MISIMKILLLAIVLCLSQLTSVVSVWATDLPKAQKAPQVSPEEAELIHWRLQDGERRFTDISLLENAYTNAQPEDLKDGIQVGELDADGIDSVIIDQLAKNIAAGKHGDIDSLLIAHKNKLVFESYYRRGRIDLQHPQSSAGKVYVSLALGRAIQLGYLSMSDLDRPLLDFFPTLDRSKLSKGAELVTLRHAMTMRSGIRIKEEQWSDLNKTPEALAGQGLIQTYLELSAPITMQSQTFNYQNDPMLVMQVIDAVVPNSAKTFLRRELLDKLDIAKYAWRPDEDSGLPGSATMTSRAMLKFGLLVQNNGMWQGEQLIPKAFIQDATGRILTTREDDIFGGGPDVSNQGYGYYWWSGDLNHAEQTFYTVSAQGGGGIYIILIERLDLIVVVTAHHRGDATLQMTSEHIIPAFINNETSQNRILSGPYLGQKTPGLAPQVFAPGIISTNAWEYGVVFAPNMREMYWVREVIEDEKARQEFVVFEKSDQRWRKRVISARVGTPTLSPDGNTMFFGRSYKTRQGSDWSDMQRLGPEFEDIRIMRVTSSATGTLAIDEATPKGNSVLRYSPMVKGKRQAPVPFPETINTGEWNAHPFIAPDESYLIWDGQREGEQRNADLYISFKQANEQWGEAIKMGPEINTDTSEFAAQVTPDGKYLFFNRTLGSDNVDTFWVDAAIIETYRPK
jgi:CubicO group peptidase (beta-lactamase class C family)